MRERPHTRFWRLLGVTSRSCRRLACIPEPTVSDAGFAIASATALPMDSERMRPDHPLVGKDGRGAAVLPAGEIAQATREIAGGRYLGARDMAGVLEAIVGRRAAGA